MAIGHLAVRAHSRKRGHSAAAALAYRAGESLTCSRTGEKCDFRHRSRKQQVLCSGFAGIGNPHPQPRRKVALIAQRMADEIEAAEDAGAQSKWHRENACLGRDIQPALPRELSDEQNARLVATTAVLLARRYRARVAWFVHRPDREGHPDNTHAHIFLPSRNRYGEKISVLNDRTTGGAEVKWIRTLFQDLANAALIAAGHEPTVNTGRRADANPQPTLGAAKTGRERRHRRDNRLPYEGLSVADMCSDGHCVTGTGRRLERYVKEAEIQIEKENEQRIIHGVDADKVEPIFVDPGVAKTPVARNPRRRRRRERNRTAEPVALPTRSAADAGTKGRSERAPRRKPRTRRAVTKTVPVRPSTPIAEPRAPARQQAIEALPAAPTVLPVRPSTPIAEHAAPARQRTIEALPAPPTVLPVRPVTTSVHAPATSQRAQWTPPQWLAGYSVERAAAEGLIQHPAAPTLPAPAQWHPPQWLAGTALDALAELPEPMRRPPELDPTPLPAPIEISERPDSGAPTPQTTGERTALNQQLKERTAQKRWDQENLARLHRLITHERAGALAHELLEHYAVGRKRPGLRGLEEDANEALLAAIEPEIVDAHHIATRNTPEAFALARDTLERSWTRPGHAERLKRIVDQTFPAYSKQRARARLQAAQKYLATTGGRNPGRDPPRER